MIAFTSDQWVIVALIFILGLLIGAFLTAGGRRKWKARYREEAAKRELRLNLLLRFRDAVHRVADFSKIEG